jgi:hypothetical protein
MMPEVVCQTGSLLHLIEDTEHFMPGRDYRQPARFESAHCAVEADNLNGEHMAENEQESIESHLLHHRTKRPCHPDGPPPSPAATASPRGVSQDPEDKR